MPPKRKVSFDPDAAKARAKKAKDNKAIFSQFEEVGQALLDLTSQNGPELSTYTPSSPALAEILLVATVGLKGVQWLNVAHKSIPQNHPHRLQQLKCMLDYAIPETSATTRAGLYGAWGQF
jgi:hypothetical protein